MRFVCHEPNVNGTWIFFETLWHWLCATEQHDGKYYKFIPVNSSDEICAEQKSLMSLSWKNEAEEKNPSCKAYAYNVFKAHKLYVLFFLAFLINFLRFLCLLQSFMCLCMAHFSRRLQYSINPLPKKRIPKKPWQRFAEYARTPIECCMHLWNAEAINSMQVVVKLLPLEFKRFLRV